MGDDRSDEKFGLSMFEFVTLTAFLMAMTALSVDIMLPALPEIAGTYGLGEINHQQFMVTIYMGSFAFGQIFAGPISDRIGRKPTLLAGLVVYLLGSLLAIFAESYTALLVARAIQGFGASAPRVVAVAVVRDRFSGRAMSQVMSFVMTVFIMLPVVAPAIGAAIGAIGSWRLIFIFLLLFGIGTFVWVLLRLPETNPRGGPEATPAVPIGSAVATICNSAQTIGYMLGLGCIFGCLLTYVSSTQQVFADLYGIVEWFPLVFASVAGMMIISSVVNASLVKRYGMRLLSHSSTLLLLASSVLALLGEIVFG
ncbi:MAG: MFS transporter, partial [Pseudomonadota bacterium]